MKYLLLVVFMLPVQSYAAGKVWQRGDPLPFNQSWPKLGKVVLLSSVAAKNNSFAYLYTLLNPSVNKLPINGLELDLRANPGRHPFSRQDITALHSQLEHMKILEDAVKVPIENASAPSSWDSSKYYGQPFTGGWGAVESRDVVLPGGKLSGFTVSSVFPPGIREYIANGWDYDFEYGIDRLPPEKFNYYSNSEDYRIETSKGIEYLGKVIGPVPAPEPFTASSWTLRMTEYAVEARKQKWIKTDKVLAEIKRLISGLNTEDVGKLKAAVKKTEAYVIAEKKKGNMTDEADALVRLNAQYLLRRRESPAEKSYGETKP